MEKLIHYLNLSILGLLLFQCQGNTINEYSYYFQRVTETSGDTSWIFNNKLKPPINLSNDVAFIRDVNLVLDTLNLPKIDNAVREKEKLTGYRSDRTIFEWEDYSLGILQVKRTTSTDLNNSTYDCIWKVTLIEKRLK